MNYLTQYYKNLSEQLKVRYVSLQKFLAEDVNVQSDETSNMLSRGSRPPVPGATPDAWDKQHQPRPGMPSPRPPAGRPSGPTRPPFKAAQQQQQPNKQTEKRPGGRGDGLSQGWEKPHGNGPNSPEWKKWVGQPGNWHTLNPHQYGTPEFYKWEHDYYQQPPGP